MLSLQRVILKLAETNNKGIETPAHVTDELLAAAKYMPTKQIQAAPDRGLVPLSLNIARAKLRETVEGAQLSRERLG